MAQGSEVGLVSLQTHTHTEQLTVSLLLVSGDVLHTKPLCPPPKHTLLSQRAGSSVSPPSHCPLSLSLLSFLPSLFLSTAKQIPSSNCHLYPKLSLSQPASSLTLSLLAFSFLPCFCYSIRTQTIPHSLHVNRSDSHQQINSCKVQ